MVMLPISDGGNLQNSGESMSASKFNICTVHKSFIQMWFFRNEVEQPLHTNEARVVNDLIILLFWRSIKHDFKWNSCMNCPITHPYHLQGEVSSPCGEFAMETWAPKHRGVHAASADGTESTLLPHSTGVEAGRELPVWTPVNVFLRCFSAKWWNRYRWCDALESWCWTFLEGIHQQE